MTKPRAPLLWLWRQYEKQLTRKAISAAVTPLRH
jgi:hypothetical protein